ncbi:MAG: ATPase, T2SS/T4P/T4SS family [archaeon]
MKKSSVRKVRAKKSKSVSSHAANLIPHLRKALKQGYKKENLRRALLERGWPSKEIEDAFKLVGDSAENSKVKKLGVPKKLLKKKAVVEKVVRKDVVETYNVSVDKANITISIERGLEGLSYNLYMPTIEIGTRALLDDIRNELVAVTAIAIGETVDQEAIIKMKKRFMEEASKIITDKVPHIEDKTKDFLIGTLMQEMLGLGKMEFLINDPNLEEIVVVSETEPIRVYHKKYGWLSSNVRIRREEEINNYANIIARRVGRQINILSPLLDAHIVTGDRANAVLYPIATKGNTITLRKFARDPWTMIDLIMNSTVSLDVAALLWLAVEYEMNVLISGGTASGKTVFLNACMPFIPPNHRIISIEDTRELMLPNFLYWCPLVTRTPNPEGKGEVSMLDLLVNSLRMRPDRIVLGEMRRQKEAEVLFEAMHTGHSVYATVHADTAGETINRLTHPPINVPVNLLKAVNLNIVMFRDRRKGVRRVFQVAEFIVTKDDANPNILYRYVPEKDQILKHSESLSFYEELNRHTGMSQSEINSYLKEKKDILEWLIKNRIRSLNEMGKVMSLYYTNRERLFEIIKHNRFEEIKSKSPITTEEKTSIKEDKDLVKSAPIKKKSKLRKKKK